MFFELEFKVPKIVIYDQARVNGGSTMGSGQWATLYSEASS